MTVNDYVEKVSSKEKLAAVRCEQGRWFKTHTECVVCQLWLELDADAISEECPNCHVKYKVMVIDEAEAAAPEAKRGQ